LSKPSRREIERGYAIALGVLFWASFYFLLATFVYSLWTNTPMETMLPSMWKFMVKDHPALTAYALPPSLLVICIGVLLARDKIEGG
jgi:hypothetical protein